MNKLLKNIYLFFKAYIKSMRLYYAFLTGIPGWLGLSFYEHIATDFKTVEIIPSDEKKIIIILLLFFSWGINQIINDFLGLKEDRINAPERPMVAGELKVVPALILSGVLITAASVIIWFYLEPIALIPLITGVLLNIIYEYAKGYGFLGNFIFGIMMTMVPVFGFLASGPISTPYFTKSRISSLFIIWLLNSIMTFFTYFKDYKGDRIAGKETLVVKFGLKNAGVIGLIISFLPSLTFIMIYLNNKVEAKVNNVFIILGILTTIMHIGTGILFYKNPEGEKAKTALLLNFRACICGHATLISLFNKELSLLLFIVSYILIGYLFHFYRTRKSQGLI